MNPRVTAWMAATGETTLDGAGYKYAIWISQRWAEWKRLQGRNLWIIPLSAAVGFMAAALCAAGRDGR